MNFRQFLGVICAKTCIKAAFQVLLGEPHLEASNGGGIDLVSREKIKSIPASRRTFWFYPVSHMTFTLF